MIDAIRLVCSTENVNAFIEAYELNQKDIAYAGAYIYIIYVFVTSEQIEAMASADEVTYIGGYTNNIPIAYGGVVQ